MKKAVQEKGRIDIHSLIRKVVLLSNCYRQLVIDKKNELIHRAKEDFVTFFSFKYCTVQDHESFITAVKKGVRFILKFPRPEDVFTEYLTYFEISIEGFEKYRYSVPVTGCGQFIFKELDSKVFDKEGMIQRDDEVERLKVVIDAINIKIQDFSDQKFCYGIFKKYKDADTPDNKTDFPQYETFIELLDATFSRLK